MIEWGKVPWTLWVFAALSLAPLILIEVEIHGQVASKVIFPFFVFAWLFFLLKGVRWVWIVTLGLSVLGLATDLIFDPLTWQGVAGNAISIGLLLLPATRRYFASEPATADT